MARRRGHLAPLADRSAAPAVPVMLVVGDTAYTLTGVQAAMAVLAALHPDVCNQTVAFFQVRYEVTPQGVELRDDRHHDQVPHDRYGVG